MEVKPGYKQTEVGVIPDEWEVKTLGSLCAKVQDGNYGYDYPKSHEFLGFGVPFLTSKAIGKNGQLRPELIDFISAEKHAQLTKAHIQTNDVLFTNRGASVGAIGLVDDRIDQGNIGPQLTLLRPEPLAVSSTFLFQIMKSAPVQRQILSQDSGSAMRFFGIAETKRFLIPIPRSRAEQVRIADALSDVDALLSDLDRVIAKKRDIKQAAMHQLLTGQTRLPGFHSEWDVKTFGELFNFSGGYSASRDQLSSEGHCYLHYGDIHGATKTFVDVRADYQNIPKLDIPLKRFASKSLLEDGDVVFVDASEDDEGTSRHIVVVNKDKKPFISGLHTIVAKSKTDELVNEYRRYCFQTAAIRQQFLFYAVGTKVSGISKTNIAKLTLPVPSVPEQTAIAEILSDTDAELAALEQQREKTRDLKQAMMQELLTGKTRLVSPKEAHAGTTSL